MHLISYRGPGAAGGVSAALARAWECNIDSEGKWWHLEGEELSFSMAGDVHATAVATVPADIIKGHYRFCNDFLWPLMHDLPEYASYNSDDYAAYNTFNDAVGWCLLRSRTAQDSREYFIQDYQLAFIPYALKKAGLQSIMFWHIPWPKSVDGKWCEPIKDIVRGMLQSEGIGFHTQEYSSNFMKFVQQHLPEYQCNPNSATISMRTTGRQHTTRLVVAPLGIDYEHWSKLGSDQRNTLWHPALMRTPFVLSVDRADYTKGVTNRMQAIDRFFARHPEWVGRIVFAQICGKTRGGLNAFDKYWQECQSTFNQVRNRWSTDSWQPLLWIESSFAPPDLAHAYRTASAMLISAVRDGLNLTAKEFVAAQGPRAGVLALSTEAGAWQELGNHTISVKPDDIDQMAESIHQALAMDAHERAWRMTMLQNSVRSNTLDQWWWNMTGPSAPGIDRIYRAAAGVILMRKVLLIVLAMLMMQAAIASPQPNAVQDNVQVEQRPMDGVSRDTKKMSQDFQTFAAKETEQFAHLGSDLLRALGSMLTDGLRYIRGEVNSGLASIETWMRGKTEEQPRRNAADPQQQPM